MTVWHYRGYMVRFKNDGTQYYEIRRNGEKVMAKPSMIDAIQWINADQEIENEPIEVNPPDIL